MLIAIHLIFALGMALVVVIARHCAAEMAEPEPHEPGWLRLDRWRRR